MSRTTAQGGRAADTDLMGCTLCLHGGQKPAQLGQPANFADLTEEGLHVRAEFADYSCATNGLTLQIGWKLPLMKAVVASRKCPLAIFELLVKCRKRHLPMQRK